MRILLFLSDLMIPLLFFYIIGFGLLMKKDIYNDFVTGAFDGLKTVVKIMPTLIGLMTGVGILRASGFLDALASLLENLLKPTGFPSALVPLSIVKMFSSSAATSLLLDLYKQHGPDSTIGLTASLILSSTETIFYTLSVYYIAAKVQKTRYTLPGALLATFSGIIASTIIQNMAQIKEQFKDSWETIPGNSDTLLYLGGNESSTHKYISEALGKSTIDTKTHGETKGKSGSWSTNMQISGRELLTPDEVRRLDNRYAILLIRGAGPVMDLKYDLMKHPAVRQTSLAGGPPYIHHRQNQAPVISGHEFFAAFSTDDANENKENAA